MDLSAVVKQKNDHLLVQNMLLQQHLCSRFNIPQFRSFMATFVVAPFVLGAAAQLVLGSKSSMSRHVLQIVLPTSKFWPFL